MFNIIHKIIQLTIIAISNRKINNILRFVNLNRDKIIESEKKKYPKNIFNKKKFISG
jgi:hypothetical protein